MPSQQQIRRVVLTGAVAAITATGAWYGAGLKTQQELKQGRKSVMEASPAERITQLERTRSALVSKRQELDRKIKELDARNATNAKAGAQNGE